MYTFDHYLPRSPSICRLNVPEDNSLWVPCISGHPVSRGPVSVLNCLVQDVCIASGLRR